MMTLNALHNYMVAKVNAVNWDSAYVFHRFEDLGLCVHLDIRVGRTNQPRRRWTYDMDGDLASADDVRARLQFFTDTILKPCDWGIAWELVDRKTGTRLAGGTREECEHARKALSIERTRIRYEIEQMERLTVQRMQEAAWFDARAFGRTYGYYRVRALEVCAHSSYGVITYTYTSHINGPETISFADAVMMVKEYSEKAERYVLGQSLIRTR